MRTWSIRILLAVLVLGTLAGMVAWWVNYRASRHETYTVDTGTLLAGVTVSGTVECRETASVDSEILAAVRRLAVDKGDTVTRGQVLIELDDSIVAAECAKAQAQVEIARQFLAELKAGSRPEQIEQAQQTVAAAQARYALALKEYRNTAALAESGGASQSELDQAISELRVAEAAYKEAQARLKLLQIGSRQEQVARAALEVRLAEAELARCEALRTKYTLRAPHNGVVTARYVNVGEVVSPDQTLLQIDNLQSIRISAAAQETQLQGLQPDSRAQVIADAYPDAPFEAVVEEVVPRVSPETGTVEVVLRLEALPEVQLMNGMAVDIALIRQRKDRVVRVPVDAVVGEGAEAFVYVRDGGGFVRRPVRTGISDGQWTEILAGLTPGEIIRR